MRRVLSLAVLASTLAALLFAGCPAQKGDIKIGVVLPLSGDGAVYGQKEKEGIDLAAEEINATGGIGGARIVLIYEDSQGLPAPAAAATERLLTQERIKAIIGDAFSSPTLAMVPITDKAGAILMSPTASAPKLSGSSDFFFRVWPSDVFEASAMADVAVDKLKFQSFAVLAGNNEYALGLKGVFESAVADLGGKILVSEGFNDGDKDFRAQLSKIKRASPDAIYMTGYSKDFALILRQAKEVGVKAKFLSCGTFNEPEVLKLAGTSAEGVVFVQPYYDRSSPDSVTKAFVSRYESRFKSEAGIYSAHAYDAMMTLAAAMKKGHGSTAQIRDNLLALGNYRGVTGDIAFQKGGDVIKPVRLMTVTSGQFVDFRANN